AGDRQRVVTLLRDFRVLATALKGEIPPWLESLERLLEAPTTSEAPTPRPEGPRKPMAPAAAPLPLEPVIATPVVDAPVLPAAPLLPAIDSPPAPAAPTPHPETALAPSNEDDETVNLG